MLLLWHGIPKKSAGGVQRHVRRFGPHRAGQGTFGDTKGPTPCVGRGGFTGARFARRVSIVTLEANASFAQKVYDSETMP